MSGRHGRTVVLMLSMVAALLSGPLTRTGEGTSCESLPRTVDSLMESTGGTVKIRP